MGETPIRSRRCEGRVISTDKGNAERNCRKRIRNITVIGLITGRLDVMGKPKSEDLPLDWYLHLCYGDSRCNREAFQKACFVMLFIHIRIKGIFFYISSCHGHKSGIKGNRGKNMDRKAIVLISFGTSYLDTKKKTLDRIKNQIRQAFPEYRVYEAFTSAFIKRVLQKREGITIYNVEEVMEAVSSDGMEEVIVQPTHLLHGVEHDKMMTQLAPYREKFSKLTVGVPLLTDIQDYRYLIKHLMKEMPPTSEKEAIVFMGHGSEHCINITYSSMNDLLRVGGYEHAYVGTVKAYPYLEDVLEELSKGSYEKIYLTPFMIVAGEHANTDMLGEQEDSWINILKEKGYEVEPIVRGLGEYDFVSTLFIKHIKDTMK